MRVLVTGAEGFVAQHLLPLLREAGAEVVGTVLQPSANDTRAVPTRPLDITQSDAVRSVFEEVQPTHVVHLAAVSSVRDSFLDPRITDDVNVHGTRNVLEAAANLAKPPRVLIIGSSDEYGPNNGEPLREVPVTELHPVSPYGESKRAVEELIESDARFRALTMRTRSFPHIGPGQRGRFFIAEVVRQLLRIERGEQPATIGVGNLDAIRDFTDVRDVVRAYVLLLTHGRLGEVYNVCSGVGVRIRDLLHTLMTESGVTAHVEVDPAKVRPVDIPVLIGDPAKVRAATGWAPHIVLRDTLRAIFTDIRQSG